MNGLFGNLLMLIGIIFSDYDLETLAFITATVGVFYFGYYLAQARMHRRKYFTLYNGYLTWYRRKTVIYQCNINEVEYECIRKKFLWNKRYILKIDSEGKVLRLKLSNYSVEELFTILENMQNG